MFFAKLTNHQRRAMKSALAAASPLLAFRVQDHAAQETAAPIAPRQKFERRFTLASSSDAKTASVPLAVEQLIVSTPGVTFVSFDADATVPIVKISAEQREVVEAFDVVQRGSAGLEIRLTAPLEKRLYVLTEVSLPVAYALRSLDVHGSGTVVLEDNVLPTNDEQAAVAITLSGSGDVFATSHTDLRLRSLTLDLNGSGDVQFVAPSVTLRDSFSTRIASSGDVRVFAGAITAPRVALSTAGSGDMQIAALSVEALAELKTSVSGSGSIKTIGETLKADTVHASIAGSGGVKLVTKSEFVANTVQASVSGSGGVRIASANARCADGRISIAGSGTVDARDLVAHHATANVAGSGSVLIRAGEAIKVTKAGSGSVTVVGDLPPRVMGSPRTQTVEQKPSKLDLYAHKRMPSIPAPTRIDAFEKLTNFSGTINIHSFSDFVDAVKLVWNHQKGDNIEVKMKAGGATSDDERP